MVKWPVVARRHIMISEWMTRSHSRPRKWYQKAIRSRIDENRGFSFSGIIIIGGRGNIYLVIELCEGGDLFSRILHHYERLKQAMTESHVAFMMQQILSATKYCHDRGIIHRDIKRGS